MGTQSSKVSINTGGISRQRILELVRYGLYIFCFVGVFMHLIEYDNVLFQTKKDLQNMISMLFFVIIIMIAQRTKLFNLPSLIITVLFVVPAYLQTWRYFRDIPDMFPAELLDRIVLWIVLMIITDMIYTKRIRKLKQMNLTYLVMFCLSAFLMIVIREWKATSLNLVLLLLFFFVDFDKREWERIVRSLFAAGLVSFILCMILSFSLNPFVPGERWYGYFLNIGPFGLFLGLITVMAVISIFYVKEKYGRLHPLYFLSWIWLLAVLGAEVLNGTTTYLVGLLFLIATIFVYRFGKNTQSARIKRILILITLFLLFSVLTLFLVQVASDSESMRNSVESSAIGSSLKNYTTGVYKIIDKIAAFRDSVNGERADFIQSSALTFLHTFTSKRVGIINTFMRNTSFSAGYSGYMYHGYYAFNAHNQYAQHLYEYGYLAGGMFIIFLVFGFVLSCVGYVRSKSKTYLAPLLVMAMLLGLWMGERCPTYYPVTFFSLFLLAPVIVWKLPQKETEEVKETKKNRTAIIVMSILSSLLLCFFIMKLVRMNANDAKGVEQYAMISDEENVQILGFKYDADKIKTAAWGNRGYLVFPFRGVNTDDVLQLKFKAYCEGAEDVDVTVFYETQVYRIKVGNEPSEYFTEFKGIPEDNNLLFIIEGGDGLNSPVIISNIVLDNLGPKNSLEE